MFLLRRVRERLFLYCTNYTDGACSKQHARGLTKDFGPFMKIINKQCGNKLQKIVDMYMLSIYIYIYYTNKNNETASMFVNKSARIERL